MVLVSSARMAAVRPHGTKSHSTKTAANTEAIAIGPANFKGKKDPKKARNTTMAIITAGLAFINILLT